MYRRLSLLLLCSSGCLLPFAIPPSKVDASGGVVLSSRAPQDTAFHLNAGLSLNSAQIDEQAPLDVQLGYALHASPNTDLLQGVYGAFSWFTPSPNGFLRAEFGARGEVLVDPFGDVSLGTFVRAGGEIFGAGTGPFESYSSDGTFFGVMHGTGSFELFVDMGRIQDLGEGASTYVGIGAGVRIPAIIGLFFGIPW